MLPSERKIVSKYWISTSTDEGEWYEIHVNGVRTRYSINKNGDVINRIFCNKPLKQYLADRNGNKYHYYQICVEGKVCTIIKARILAALFITIPNKYRSKAYDQDQLEVIAKDGNLLNTDLNNLEWITTAERTQRYVDLNRGPVGEKCHLSKITEDTARQICEMLQDGKNAKYIREHIPGVTDNILYAIKYRTSWKNVSKNFIW